MTDGREHLDALKAAADPARVADALGLRGSAGRSFCPACQPDGGKTPDLSVTDKGFVCFKCGRSGDLLKLVEVAGRLDFPKAVAFLEDLTGIRPPERPRGKGGIKPPVRSWTPDPVPDKAAPDPAVLDAFLTACRPVEGPALAWLKAKVPNMTDALVEGLRLRFCGREYPAVMDALKERFGDAALLTAGLLKRSKTGRLVPSFWHYYAKKAGFLVIPYLLDGRPVFLKARPPVSRAEAGRRELVPFLNTGGTIPVLYNVDALTAQPVPDRVAICEGESDTWAALTGGWAAVGSPGARSFKPAWVEGFRAFQSAGRSRVYLVPDADAAGAAGERIIADLFLKAGLPVPLKLNLPPGLDLCGYMKGGATCK
jgi:hypothetical protein